MKKSKKPTVKQIVHMCAENSSQAEALRDYARGGTAAALRRWIHDPAAKAALPAILAAPREALCKALRAEGYEV